MMLKNFGIDIKSKLDTITQNEWMKHTDHVELILIVCQENTPNSNVMQVTKEYINRSI